LRSHHPVDGRIRRVAVKVYDVYIGNVPGEPGYDPKQEYRQAKVR
jgi:hypothetical protein